MALKLTRKGIAVLAVVGFFVLGGISMFTAWYLVTDAGQVSLSEIIACSSLTGCNDDDPSTGGGGSGVQCSEPRADKTADGCMKIICDLGCNGSGTCNPGDKEYGASTSRRDLSDCTDDFLDLGNDCGQTDWTVGGQYCQVIDVNCDCNIDQKCDEECRKDSNCTDGTKCIKSGDNELGVCRNPDCPDNPSCSCPPPVETNDPPACDSLRITNAQGATITKVTSLTQPIKVTIKASDPDGTPKGIKLFSAVAKQSPPNASFDCQNADPAAPNYSYYCAGLNVFALAGESTNSGSLVVNTTFQQLETLIKGIGVGLNVRSNGVYLTANVTNDADSNICSSNISRNSGNGALYNGGAWDVACKGGCNANLFYEPPSARCGDGTCNQSNETCENNKACDDGSTVACRADCTFCGDGNRDPGEQCDDGNTNNNDTCRNDCTTPPEVTPECGDDVCNQDSEKCENNKSCEDGSAVSCRADCTFCGDGNRDAGEECDDGNDIDDDECSNICKKKVVVQAICTDGECNQDTETCENNKSCSTGESVQCRDNCTYCGDGFLNGNEECDDGNTIDDDECKNDCTLPYCGDGNVDEGEQCDDGNDIDDDGCSNDCKEPLPPSWSIEKEGLPVCVTEDGGKEEAQIYADVSYKITVRNNGQGRGEIDKLVDTLDSKVQTDWLLQPTVQPSATWAVNLLEWQMTSANNRLSPGEVREFLYMIRVPQSDFGEYTNTAELFPIDGSPVEVTENVTVTCEGELEELPESGLIDSSLMKFGIGLIVISLSGIYFYLESTDKVLLRFIFKDERVRFEREKFEGKSKKDEK